MEKLCNVFQGEVPSLISKKPRRNTFLMDLWLRLGTWLFYGRKCEMGILFCLAVLGGFKLLRSMNLDDEILKISFLFNMHSLSLIHSTRPPSFFFFLILFIMLCSSPYSTGPPSCLHIQLPSLLSSFLTTISGSPVPPVSRISLNSPFPFPPASGPSRSLLPPSSVPEEIKE